jgi:hypothetical protein
MFMHFCIVVDRETTLKIMKPPMSEKSPGYFLESSLVVPWFCRFFSWQTRHHLSTEALFFGQDAFEKWNRLWQRRCSGKFSHLYRE